jgi:hypothetical protein
VDALVAGVPFPLALMAGICLVLGGIALLATLGRIGNRITGRRRHIGALSTLFALLMSATLLASGGAAVSLAMALQSYRAFTKKTRVAELQCLELEPGKLRVYYVPIEADGARGATQTFDLAGDEWAVAGDVLRFRPFLTQFGVSTVHKVTRVEGRWRAAADANSHKPTAYDVNGGTTAGWLELYRDGTRGPLGWMVEGAHGQAISQLPDRRAVFDIYITPGGYVVDKRSL